MLFRNFFAKKIADLKAKNLYRSLKVSDVVDCVKIRQNDRDHVSFCSNDYLKLSQNDTVKAVAIEAIEGNGFGSGGSRYICGNSSLYQKLEAKLAQLKKTDDAIVFGSGYLAGVSVIPAIIGKGDLIIADKLIHSCLIDGTKLSGAKMLRFAHNDMESALKILKNNREKYQKCLIITETVFSMDGDLGKVAELLDLALNFDALLLSDDAHGLGIIKNEYDKKYQNIHLQMGTLSKGAGGYGGYVCASQIFIDYLRNFAKSAIYSTALPPNVIAGNLKSLEIIENDKILGKKALKNARYFCKLMKLPDPQSAIVVIIVGDAKKALEISDNLKKEGFLISAIRPPTVEKGKARLRITFNSAHKKENIEDLVGVIRKYLDTVDILI